MRARDRLRRHGGKIIIVRPMATEQSERMTFEEHIDGREFRAGRRYSVDEGGMWEEVVEGEELIRPDLYPISQLRVRAEAAVTSMAWNRRGELHLQKIS